MTRQFAILAVVVGLCCGAVIAAPTRAPSPQFALQPGLELHYLQKSGCWFDGADGKPDIPRDDDGSPKYETSERRIFVLNRHDDGSYRVVMQGMSVAGDPYITWADLFPDGRLALIPLATRALEFESLRAIFPVLPNDSGEQQAGWDEVEPRSELRLQFSQADGVITAECRTPLTHVSMGRETRRYRLDPQTYLPVEITTDSRFDKYKETDSIIVTLQDAVRHDEAWLAKFSDDATRYFDVIGRHARFRRSKVMTLAKAEQAKAGAAGERIDVEKASLTAARDGLTEPLFRSDLDRALAEYDESRAHLVATAEYWASLAGKPMPPWTVLDLDGNEHSLAQYAGRVVVLDFWFRQCSFCIRAMPQVEQTASMFRREESPVSFLGVSVDDDESDAKFVADAMKLSYPVLHSTTLAEQLGVRSYPTLLVIAPDGSLQGIFVGHTSMLREDLTECIQGILAK